MGKEKCCCNVDIFTEHAPLIHKAREIQFQLGYDNGGDPASITDIDKRNVQFALESYWSKVGIPVVNEIPSGAKNRVNLVYETADEFVPNTLEVFLSGLKLNGVQTDPERDYTVTTVGPLAFKQFTIVLAPGSAHRLNKAPYQDEPLLVSYGKRITFDTKGGT